MICREQERLARLVITKDDAGVSWDTLFLSQSGGGLPLVPIQWPESLRAGAESSFERAPPDREGRALRLIGGLDMSPVPHGPPAQTSKGCPVQSNTREAAVACLVIIESTSLDVVYKDTVCVELDEPYVPFFLAFR